MRRRPALALVLLVTAGLLLAACGDDDGGDAAPTTTAAASSEAETTTTEADTTTTTGAETTATSAAAGPGAGFDPNDFDDLCELARAGETVGATQFDDIDPFSATPEDLEAVFASATGFLDRAAEIAPAEIQGDFVLIAGAFGGLVELLAEFDFDFLALAAQAETNPEVTERLAALDDPRLEEASENVAAYLESTCGVTG